MHTNHSLFHTLPDFDLLIARLEQIRHKIESEYNRLASAIPDCTWNDARITTFAHLGNIVDATNLAFTFMNEHLLPLENSWWQETHKPPFASFNDYHKSITINSFNNGFIKVGFVQNLFSILDSKFRIFLRELDPSAEKGATTEFYNIHVALKGKITSFPPDSDELIKVLRLIRNTIHNNGVYFNKKGNDEKVTYKSTTYEFCHSKPINFANWEWLIDRLDDVRQLLELVVSDPKIISIPTEVTDPFSSNRKKLSLK